VSRDFVTLREKHAKRHKITRSVKTQHARRFNQRHRTQSLFPISAFCNASRAFCEALQKAETNLRSHP
jgi:hypothetical protein